MEIKYIKNQKLGWGNNCLNKKKKKKQKKKKKKKKSPFQPSLKKQPTTWIN